MPEKPRIVVVGSANQDLVVKCERIPQPGETVLGSSLLTVSGGKGANQAVAAAKLGGAVSLVGRVGADSFGENLLAAIGSAGVDTRYVVRDGAAATGVALIGVAEDGQNAIIVAPGANAALTPEDVDAAHGVIAAAAVVVAQLEIPAPAVQRACELAQAAGAVMVLNPAPIRHTSPLPGAILSRIDVLTPNEHEAANLIGCDDPGGLDMQEVARALLELGPRAVVITLGAEGCLVATRSEMTRIPAPRVAAVDTTAAGDCFTGALATSVGEGADLLTACRFAVAAASISVTRVGAQPSLPMRAEVDAARPI